MPEIEESAPEPRRLQVDAAGAPGALAARRRLRGRRGDRPAARPDLRGRRPGGGRGGGPRARPLEEGRRAGGRPRGARRPARRGGRELMHLRSITLKGFKSFPDRTRMEFGPGRVGHRRPERLGQVQRHRRGALGDGRAVAARGARAVDAGRHLRRRSRRAGAHGGGGRAHPRQRRRHDRPPGRRDLHPPAARPLGRRRVPAQRRALPPRRRAGDPQRHRPGQGDALRRLPGPRRGDRHLQARATAGCSSRRPPASASTASAAAARSSSSSARRRTSTARWTSSARRARGCARSSARPRPRSCTSAWSARSTRRAGSSRATPCAPGARR